MVSCPGAQWTTPDLEVQLITDRERSKVHLPLPERYLGWVTTLCHDIPHPSDRQPAASSLSSDLEKKNHKMIKHLEYVFQS